MPRSLPADWTADYLNHPSLVVLVEVFRDGEIDGYWSGTIYNNPKTRRSFWSRDITALRTAQSAYADWIEHDRLLEWDKVDQGLNTRGLGQVGMAATFSCVLDNRPYDQASSSYETLLEHYAGDGTYPAKFLGRPARVCLMRDDASNLYNDVVPVLAGRVADLVMLPGNRVKLTIRDERTRSKEKVPRNVYSNEQSTFPGFRAPNSLHGKYKPWLFGEVPHARGMTVVLGYEDTADIKGRRIEFCDREETWQEPHAVGELEYGHTSLIDATESRGYSKLNQDSGGWVTAVGGDHSTDRSAHTKLVAYTGGPSYGFFFDTFNQKYLYLKIDFVFSFQDEKRATAGYYDGVTDAENVVDPSPDTYATTKAVDESSDPRASIVVLPWPHAEDLSLVVEGTPTDSWRPFTEQPPSATNYGFFVFWKFDTDGKLGVGSYVYCTRAVWSGSVYNEITANGPARFLEGDSAPDNYHSGSRETYPMDHRNNPSAGSGVSSSVPMNLSDYAVRQGEGQFLVFGVVAPSGDGGGSVSAGVKLYNIGVRVWAFMEFPDDALYSDVEGYRAQGDGWSDATWDEPAVNPLDVLGLLIHYGLRLPEPGSNWAYGASWWAAQRVGRQVLEQESGDSLVQSLCEDCNLALWGGHDLHNGQGGHTGDGSRAILLPYLEAVARTLDDSNTDLVPDSLKPSHTPLTEVYTRFVFKYGWSELRSEYDHVVTLSPTELDMPEGMSGNAYLNSTLQTLLGERAIEYSKDPERNTYTHEAQNLHDHDTAAYHFAFMARNLSKRRAVVESTTGMRHVDLQLGDTVLLDWSELPYTHRTVEVEAGVRTPEYVVWRQQLGTRRGRITWRMVEVEPLERHSTTL